MSQFLISFDYIHLHLQLSTPKLLLKYLVEQNFPTFVLHIKQSKFQETFMSESAYLSSILSVKSNKQNCIIYAM